jgi:hypothetical protein
MKPAWLKLNEQWQAEHHFGLTIPFLLGAIHQWSGQPFRTGYVGVEQMRELLASIRDDVPDGIIMRLYVCDKRHELILAPVAHSPANCIAISSVTRTKPAFFVEKGVVPDDANSFEALVNELWWRYRKEIQSGLFSLDENSAFSPFKDDDYRIIRAAIIRPDDDYAS